jgi:hypothetical protein
MSGSKVTEFSIAGEAGQLLNASYTLEGIKYHYNPIEITSSDIYLDFTDDQGTAAAVITAKMYRDPHELADALAAAMNAQTTETHTVTYSDTDGKYTIATSTSAVLSLLWDTGANTANTVGDKIGFSVAADDTGSTSYEGDSAIDLSSPYTPSFDSSDPVVSKNHEMMIGTQSQNVCFKATSFTYTLSNTRRTLDDICAETGRSGSIMNERAVTLDVSALLDQYDADKFRKFRSNSELKAQYSFGTKDSSGNWEAGKSGIVYIANAVISDFDLADDDGLFALNMTLTGFVNDSGDLETSLNFL